MLFLSFFFICFEFFSKPKLLYILMLCIFCKRTDSVKCLIIQAGQVLCHDWLGRSLIAYIYFFPNSSQYFLIILKVISITWSSLPFDHLFGFNAFFL